jgi:acyl dehydratase
VALNADLVGRTYPASPIYQVGREKVREFARAIGESSPLCSDVDVARAAGYSDIVAPPTFAIVISMEAGRQAAFDPDLGLDYTRVVHGEQTFEYTRPIVAGDELVCTASIHAIREAAGNDILTTRADITTVSGEHVCTTYSVLVARGAES